MKFPRNLCFFVVKKTKPDWNRKVQLSANQENVGHQANKQEGKDIPSLSSVGSPSNKNQEYDSLEKTHLTEHMDKSNSDPLPQPSAAGQRHQITFGDFILTKRLGQGAMATVYKAWQISFERKIALKVLHKHASENPKLVERFYREARTMGELDHPNIVQGYSVGEVDGYHYFAMEYVSGKSLQDWILALGKLSVGDALFITLECAKGLLYAHNRGLIHRDIKPDNILITRYGQVKVADLGMVKSMDDEMSITQTGHAVGTPWYMPLEQAHNAKKIDKRSDIYSLGCVLHCMLTGTPPFTGNTIFEVIRTKNVGTVPLARKFNDEVPEKLDLIIAKMAAKLPQDRFQSCEEVIESLNSLRLSSRYLSFNHKKNAPNGNSELPPSPTPLPPQPSPPKPDYWFVRYKKAGEIVQKNLTTEEVIEQISSGQISADSKASRYPDSGFRSLAVYKEFKQATVRITVKTGADRRAAQYRELYRQLEEENTSRTEEKDPEDQLDERITFFVRRVLPILGAVLGGMILLFAVFWLSRIWE